MRKTIVASLVPRALPVLSGFAATDVRSFFLVPVRGTEAATADLAAAAAGPDVDVTTDAFGFAALDGSAIAREAQLRWDRVRAHPAYAAAASALPLAEQAQLPPNLDRIAPQSFADAISLIDVLDDLATRADVRGVIVSEDASSGTRTLVRWARARGLPSVQLTHGASPLYTVFSSRFLVDDHYLYGPHIFPSLTDAGVRDDQLHLGTFYGHAEHAPPAAGARAAFRSSLAIPEDAVVVALALGFNSFLTTFEPPGFWCLNVLTAFVEAVRLLRDRGVVCTPLIKHRWYDPQVETLARNTAAYFGINVPYFDGSMVEMLPGVDVLCASDSNTMIEATFYDRAVLNVVYPWHWHIGPQYAAGEHVPYVDARYPAQIADALERLIDDAARRTQVDRRREPFRAVVADRTRGLAGIARDLLAILERRRSTLAPATTVPRPPPLDTIVAVAPQARRILDVTGAAESTALLRAWYPQAAIDADVSTRHDTAVAGFALARSTDPASLLATIDAALDPGGTLIVQFPNARNLRYVKDVLDGRAWSHHRISRAGDALPAVVRDVAALLRQHGFTPEAVRLDQDRALALLDPNIEGESNLELGDLTVYGMTGDDLRECKAASFVVIARRTA